MTPLPTTIPDPVKRLPTPDEIRSRLAVLARERAILRRLLPISERAAAVLTADRQEEAADAR